MLYRSNPSRNSRESQRNKKIDVYKRQGRYYVKEDGTMARSEWVENGKYYVEDVYKRHP